MQGANRVKQVLRPAEVTLSGPVDTQAQCVAALKAAGMRLLHTESAGLPSHTDPITAREAGHPNAGHTPGTRHPVMLLTVDGEEFPNPVAETHGNEAYQPDPSVGFITVASDAHDTAHQIAVAYGWRLRRHTVQTIETLEDISLAERLARIESDLLIVKAGGQS